MTNLTKTLEVSSDKRRREEREEKEEREEREEREKEKKDHGKSWNIMEHHGTSWIIMELRIECRLIMIDP